MICFGPQSGRRPGVGRGGPVPTLSDGIDGPDDPERARRLEWSKLLKRTFAIDVLTCSRCLRPTGRHVCAQRGTISDVTDSDQELLECLLDAFDRLYDRESGVVDVQALLQATAKPFPGQFWLRLSTRRLGYFSRSSGQRDRS